MVEFDVTVKAGDLYDYMMRHTYYSMAGILGNGVGAVMVVVGAMKGQWLFVILGMVLLLYLPYTLWIKSRQQAMSNPAFTKPLHYVMDDEGITVSQDGESQTQKWEDIYKAVSTNKSIIVYTSKVNACIFPKRDLQDKTMAVIQVISTHMDPSKVKIKQ
ncbi:MAG: YcxB family protein [Lachnospiraceae bacterium]|nr:YcxB family protein [Lachnospiraceae bacterium]